MLYTFKVKNKNIVIWSSDDVLMSLLLTLNQSLFESRLFIVDSQQLIIGWKGIIQTNKNNKTLMYIPNTEKQRHTRTHP